MMKRSSTLIAIALLASAGVAFAQADNSKDSPRTGRSDPSQMTGSPAGTATGVPAQESARDERRMENRSSVLPRDRDDHRAVTRRGGAIPNEPADPSQMTTPPEGATPSGQGR